MTKKKAESISFKLLIYPIIYTNPWPFGTTHGSIFLFYHMSSRSQKSIISTPHSLDTPFSCLCLSLTVPIFRLLRFEGGAFASITLRSPELVYTPPAHTIDIISLASLIHYTCILSLAIQKGIFKKSNSQAPPTIPPASVPAHYKR